MNQLEFPKKYEELIFKQIESAGLSLKTPNELCRHIIALSDAYIQGKPIDPWLTPSSRAAYLAYFFPLNYLRCRRALQKVNQVGFIDIAESILDFGSGCGTALWAFLDHFPEFENLKADCFDHSNNALELLQQISSIFPQGIQLKCSTSPPADNLHYDLLISSYAINEIPELPQPFFKAKNILIIEPSTQEQSRQLMKLRQKYLDNNYGVWAPCTHQSECPLLTQSKKDWCHDRVHIKTPPWFKKLEQYLPIKNNSLTLSYLAVSQRHPLFDQNLVRVIGDTLREKGKTRQAICRNNQREFFSWLKRFGKPQHLQHGDLVKLPSTFEQKGLEIRVQSLIETVE